jgi:3-oxosteroid 1-dehydrogenase
VVPGDLGTCGGIRADGLARALRPDGSVIEGLYASGNAAGNAFGRVYPGPGATIGQGLSYGYAAARHAAGKLDEVAVTAARSE